VKHILLRAPKVQKVHAFFQNARRYALSDFPERENAFSVPHESFEMA